MPSWPLPSNRAYPSRSRYRRWRPCWQGRSIHRTIRSAPSAPPREPIVPRTASPRASTAPREPIRKEDSLNYFALNYFPQGYFPQNYFLGFGGAIYFLVTISESAGVAEIQS